MTNADGSHIGKVRLGIKLALTEFVDETHGLFHGGFQTTMDVGIHDDGSAVQRRVHLIDEPMGESFTLAIHIHRYLHGNAIEVFLPEILFHLVNVRVLDLFPDTTICVEVLDSADGQNFRFGIRLCRCFRRGFLDGL